ncbi:MAG: transglutaminase family protein [Akkermansiaceae bacterium]
MAIYNIKHRTVYDYAHPVTVSHHSAHVKPISNAFQTCQTFRIEIVPETHDVQIREDYFDNVSHLFSIHELHQSLVMETNSQVEVFCVVPDLKLVKMTCQELREHNLHLVEPAEIMQSEFMYPTDLTPDSAELHEFATKSLAPDVPVGDAVLSFLDVFKDEFKFDAKATEHSTPIAEVLKKRRGVCQDFAHLMIAAFRSCGICARYVSGYILSHPPEGSKRLEGADASHAWVAVLIPEIGWVEIDPTNRLVCGNEHVRVAYGRDYSDVSMLKGAVHGGGSHSVHVGVTMIPIE